MIIEDFQPGDGTRYVMCLEDIQAGPGAGILGCALDGGYLLAIPNLAYVRVIGRGQHISESYLNQRGLNPWTRRAILLWLSTKGLDLTIELPGDEPDPSCND